MRNSIVFILLFLSGIHLSYTQNQRLKDHNGIGWYNYAGSLKFHKKFGIHTEYQFRRNNFITEWQQSLLRFGVNYHLNDKIQFRMGYAWVETYPYGEIKINSMGKQFTEHRMFQMATINDKISIVEFSHRLMLEQRWIGRYTDRNLRKEDEYLFSNRFRYMFRMQLPLKGKEIKDKTPYIAIYDEILIGFGKNVNENIFDQNRIGILIGHRFNKFVRIEGGYINQILQLGREVDNKNVFQYNNGIMLNVILNLDLTKPD